MEAERAAAPAPAIGARQLVSALGLVSSPRCWKDGKQLWMMCQAEGGLQWRKMVVGAEGGALGNRKRRPLSVSPLLELASLKVCFHFQNESEGGEVSP